VTTNFTTLADILVTRQGGAHSEEQALIFQRGGKVSETIRNAELMVRAQCAAAALRANGVAPGDRVLLMLTAQADFIDAFLGAIWADAIPVPLFPPIFSRRREDFIAIFSGIAVASGARALVASDEIVKTIGAHTEHLGGGVRVISRSSWSKSGERLETAPARGQSDVALLQYTSGSTGAPKGVALSHSNVLANVQAIGRAVELSKDDIGVSWLPLYHDMGLIGVLATLYWGGRVVLLSPLDFAKNPASWLRAISDYKGTLSPAPNFAFRRCLQLDDEELEDLDLSTWRVAFNGAEPVDPITLQKFTSRFESYGFRQSALYPVYGLAEHTLAVSFPTLGQGPTIDTVSRDRLAAESIAESVPVDHRDAVSLVSVGAPLEGVAVEIRDQLGAILPETQIGEVLVKSTSVMTGYFENAAATAKVLSDGWLKTGDLGYFKDGMLYITGRIKDVIIRAGRNYYPDDIENAAIGVQGIRAGRAAAFSVPAETCGEWVVVLAECDATDDEQRTELVQQIGSAIAARVGFQPEQIELCARGTLPITSSGKVRRQVARGKFLTATGADA
jgi:acyl-CoA synthetase (AMP-forming)/AMP-acid ligase II